MQTSFRGFTNLPIHWRLKYLLRTLICASCISNICKSITVKIFLFLLVRTCQTLLFLGKLIISIYPLRFLLLFVRSNFIFLNPNLLFDNRSFHSRFNIVNSYRLPNWFVMLIEYSGTFPNNWSFLNSFRLGLTMSQFGRFFVLLCTRFNSLVFIYHWNLTFITTNSFLVSYLLCDSSMSASTLAV